MLFDFWKISLSFTSTIWWKILYMSLALTSALCSSKVFPPKRLRARFDWPGQQLGTHYEVKFSSIKYYKTTCFDLDEPHFLLQYVDTLTLLIFHFILEYRVMDEVMKTRKASGYFINKRKIAFMSLCCDRNVQCTISTRKIPEKTWFPLVLPPGIFPVKWHHSCFYQGTEILKQFSVC